MRMLVVLLSLGLVASAEASEDYRSSLLALFDLAHQLPTPDGAPASGRAIDSLQTYIRELSPADLEGLEASLPRERVERILALADPKQSGAAKLITVATLPVTPSTCEDFPGPVALVALGVKLAAQLVIAQAKAACEQTEFGTNAALGCVAPEVASASAEITSELADFCFAQQRAAKGSSVFETEKSIGEHLNTFVDAKLSTRASQGAADDVQRQVDATTTTTGELETALAADVNQVKTSMANARNATTQLVAELRALNAQATDIQFRNQINLTNIEDVQRRVASVEAIAAELETNLAEIVISAAAIRSSIEGTSSEIDSGLQLARRDSIERTLADSQRVVVDYVLPESQGGQLEEVREVVIRTILDISESDPTNTTGALALLTIGDASFNRADYFSAYAAYGTAYRILLAETVVN